MKNQNALLAELDDLLAFTPIEGVIGTPRRSATQLEERRFRATTIQEGLIQLGALENETLRPRLRELARYLTSLVILDGLLRRVDWLNHPEVLKEYSTTAAVLSPHRIKAFVVSIDIRKSTDLMLKAEGSTSAFSEFIGHLAASFARAVTQNSGIVDKFTGDGLLAYFPTYLDKAAFDAWIAKARGGIGLARKGSPLEIAGWNALEAAFTCHRYFEDIFEKYGRAFRPKPANSGLGIGIDYGPIDTVTAFDALTIIGKPVVYARRLNSAPIGVTQTTHAVWRAVQGSPVYSAKRVSARIKNEVPIEAWRVSRDPKAPVTPLVYSSDVHEALQTRASSGAV